MRTLHTARRFVRPLRRLTVVLVLGSLLIGCGDDDGTSPVDSEINGLWRTDSFEQDGVSYVIEVDITLQDDDSFRGDGTITVTDPDGEEVLDITVPRGDFADPSDTWIVLEFVDADFVALVIRGEYTGGDIWEAVLQNGGFNNKPITLRRVG